MSEKTPLRGKQRSSTISPAFPGGVTVTNGSRREEEEEEEEVQNGLIAFEVVEVNRGFASSNENSAGSPRPVNSLNGHIADQHAEVCAVYITSMTI